MPSSFRVVANLDVESHWQRLLLPHRPMPQLRRRALSLVSAYATLLRAWMEPDDPGTLWTPAPVNPARLTPLLPIPRLVSGSELQPESPDLAWGRVGECAARMNHRRFGFELATELSIALPGSAWVRDLEEVLEIVETLDRWVAKAPLSASGRDRVVGTSPPDERTVRRLRNLLRRADGLLVEPWRERVDDFGVLLEITADGGRVVSMHRQIVGETGVFVGVDWPLEDGPWSDELCRTGRGVGEALSGAGYRGPASVDAWTWRGGKDHRGGSVELNPLGEINARLSFGWVARQIGRALGRERVRLRLGPGRELSAAGDGAEPLLLPDEVDVGAAWLEA